MYGSGNRQCNVGVCLQILYWHQSPRHDVESSAPFCPWANGAEGQRQRRKIAKISVDPAAEGGSYERKGRGRAKTRALSSSQLINTREDRAVARALGHRHRHCDATVGAQPH